MECQLCDGSEDAGTVIAVLILLSSSVLLVRKPRARSKEIFPLTGVISAPARVQAKRVSGRFAYFQLVHCERFTRLHTIKDQLEVGPVSGGGTFNPLSASLQSGLRFLQPPMPALSTVSLTGYLPVSLLFV